MRSDGDDDVGACVCAAPDYPGFVFYLFYSVIFLRRWMAGLILARWIQLDPRALDLLD
jgi:hypothetical protein